VENFINAIFHTELTYDNFIMICSGGPCPSQSVYDSWAACIVFITVL